MKVKRKYILRNKSLRILTALALLIIILFYVMSNVDAFRVLMDVNWRYLTSGLFFLLLTIVSSSSENAVLYQALGAPIGYLDSFRLTNVSAFFNLIIPQGGSLTKALYLKSKYGIPYEKTVAIFLGLLIIYLVIGAAILLITNLIAVLLGFVVPVLLWSVSLISIAGCLLFMTNPSKILKHRKLGKIASMLNNFNDAWTLLREKKSTLAKASLWQFSTFIFSGIWISSLYRSLGINMSPFLGISLSVLLSFTNIIMLLPGNLGIQEAAFGYFASISGMDFSQGILTSLVARILIMILTFILLPFSWYYLFYKQDISINAKSLAGYDRQ